MFGDHTSFNLFGVKPFSEPMGGLKILHHKENISLKLESKYNNFHGRKCIENIVCNMSAILFLSQFVKT